MNLELHKDLNSWREKESSKRKVQVFRVLPNSCLDEIARFHPKNRGELKTMKGIGPQKLSLYGDTLLRIVKRHTK